MQEVFEMSEEFEDSLVSGYYTEDSSDEVFSYNSYDPNTSIESPTKWKPAVHLKPTSELMSKILETARRTSDKRMEFPNEESDPFYSFSGWNRGYMTKLQIIMPNENEMVETTNEITRRDRPEMRYWKSTIVFKSGKFESATIRLCNIQIPFVNSKNYGKNYVYMSLPIELRGKMITSAPKRFKVNPDDKTLLRQNDCWYKAVNGTDGNFGYGHPEKKEFVIKDLCNIFAASNAGIEATVCLKFFCKASTTRRQDLGPSVDRTISVEVMSGFITKVNVNVLPPERPARARITREAPTIPVLTRNELAGEDLLKDLSKLGLI